MFARVGAPYVFKNDATGVFCAMITEGFSDPYHLVFWASQDNLTAGLDVYQVIDGWICPVSARNLTRPTQNDEWHVAAQQDYQGPAKFVPAILNEGDNGTIVTNARWTWFDDQGHTGAGGLSYTNQWSFLRGRLTLEEDWIEWPDGQPSNPPYDRIHAFQVGVGRLALIDKVAGTTLGV
jgi:hypothetical protein